jgi:hypothetical protein
MISIASAKFLFKENKHMTDHMDADLLNVLYFFKKEFAQKHFKE